MPRLGSREALLLALVFAAVVVVLSTMVPGPGALLLALLPPAALFIVLYFVVRWAAGVRDAGGGAGGEIGQEDYERMRSHLETP